MKYDIEINNLANYDIYKIRNYITYKLQNPIAARNTAIGIIKKIFSLDVLPYRGKFLNQEKSNSRYISYKNFIVFYEIQEKEKLVIIKRIIYNRRNLDKFL